MDKNIIEIIDADYIMLKDPVDDRVYFDKLVIKVVILILFQL